MVIRQLSKIIQNHPLIAVMAILPVGLANLNTILEDTAFPILTRHSITIMKRTAIPSVNIMASTTIKDVKVPLTKNAVVKEKKSNIIFQMTPETIQVKVLCPICRV